MAIKKDADTSYFGLSIGKGLYYYKLDSLHKLLFVD